ncbi:MAG: response regulator [Pseudomonadota bacterium]|nr:response regulator [Pseudomonadota bacterium]
MSFPGLSPRSTASYDWSASDLGSPSNWPYALRLGADVLFNSPSPGLLVWGPESRVFYNEAYVALACAGSARAPGGSVPPLWPAPLAIARDALASARAGEPAVAYAQNLNPGEAQSFDLAFTPLRLEDGSIGGVLCALAPVTALQLTGTVDNASGMRILVVEDNLDSQYLVCEMLRAFGHEADGVAHPDDALAHLARQRYDLLFSDVSLPGMSGVDLARQALQDAPAMYVIFASGYGDTMLRHLDFPYLSLQKPYELDQLQDALAKVELQLRSRSPA